MFSPVSRGTAAVFLCSFAATSAQADLSAQDVWSDWKAYFTATGYEVTGSESMSGDTLSVSDTTLSFSVPEEDVTIAITLGTVTLTENGDGSVAIGFPTRMPVTIGGVVEGGERFDAVMSYTQSGLTMVATGSPEDLTYTYSAASAGLSLDEVTAEGQSLPTESYRATLSMTNMSGETRVQGTDLRSYTQNLTSGPISYDVFFESPDDQGTLTLTGRTESLTAASDSTLPEMMDPNNMAAMILAGFGGKGGVTFGAGSTNMAFEDASESFTYESSSAGGSLTAGIGADGISYDITSNDASVNVAGSEIPLPISLTLAKFGFGLTMPVMAEEDPQDFALSITLGDFTISDLIWGVFDPTGQLPRDPATILIALSGQATLLANIMDPKLAEDFGMGPPPGELNAVTLDTLEVTAAGASLTGEGAFTFDNSSGATLGGFPQPEGSVDLSLTGGNGLLDTLVAMGLVPEDQAMGARMMMGLFAVPGEGDDSLTSRIEINDQGHILANGQRIQ